MLYRRTLAWVNHSRADRGLIPLDRLLPGRRLNPGRCPVGRTLGDGCAASYLDIYIEGRVVPTPWFVRHFLKRFDAGRYPELNAPLGSFHMNPEPDPVPAGVR